MSSIERALGDLAAYVEFPQTPDFAAALDLSPVHPARAWRRRLAIAFAVLLVAAGAVLAASSQARSTVLDWFGIGGVRIERVPELPEVPRRTTTPFGRPTTLESAREQVAFRIRVPQLEGLGPPDRVFIDDTATGGLVTFVYGRPWNARLVISQWRADTAVHFHKLISYATEARRVRVNGGRGIWISGAPHLIFYASEDGYLGRTPVYLTGSVLVWMEGRMSHRLEADVSLADALKLAESLE